MISLNFKIYRSDIPVKKASRRSVSYTHLTLPTNPAGFQHMGDMGRIFESELIDQDEEGGERGDEYDPFGHHVQQALHIRPVHSE